jgi:8-oxo-dGTP diphosphatase
METKDKAKFHIVLVQAVVFKDGKALIAQRGLDEPQSPGTWSLPGGKVELYGEDENVIEKTLKQEFLEEVGIELQDKMDYLKSESFVRDDGSSVIRLCFIAEWKSGEAKPLEDSIAVKWIGRDDIDSFESPGQIKNLMKLAFEKYKVKIN